MRRGARPRRPRHRPCHGRRGARGRTGSEIADREREVRERREHEPSRGVPDEAPGARLRMPVRLARRICPRGEPCPPRDGAGQLESAARRSRAPFHRVRRVADGVRQEDHRGRAHEPSTPAARPRRAGEWDERAAPVLERRRKRAFERIALDGRLGQAQPAEDREARAPPRPSTRWPPRGAPRRRATRTSGTPADTSTSGVTARAPSSSTRCSVTAIPSARPNEPRVDRGARTPVERPRRLARRRVGHRIAGRACRTRSRRSRGA
jgi:hypothetical protein